MMKKTKKRIAVSLAAAAVIVAAVVLYFVLGDKPAASSKDVTPGIPVSPTGSAGNTDVTGKPEATGTPGVTEEPGVTGTPEPTVELTPAGETTPVPTLDPGTEIPVTGDEPTKVPVTGSPGPTGVPDGPTTVPAPTFEPTPVPTPTLTPVPTATPKPTATPEPTATPKPTATPVPSVEAAADYFLLELAGICGLSGADAREDLLSKGILPGYTGTEKILRKDAFVLLRNAANYLGKDNDASMYAIVRQFGRLSDVGGLTDDEKTAAYYVYANGIAEGESDGAFTRTRSMDPQGVLTKADADLYLGRLAGTEERRVLAPDGQVTRKSALRNMDLYPYILDSIPDSFYTRAFKFMTITDSNTMKPLYESGKVDGNGNTWVDGGGNYASPVMLRRMYGPDSTTGYRYHVYDSVITEKALEGAVEEYLFKAFNVDYRTTPSDTEWRTYMREMLRGQAMGSGVDAAHDALVDNYLRIMKENHTVIECDMVRAEASTIFRSGISTYIRCYVHYRVVSYDSAETVWVRTDKIAGNINPLLFNLTTENYPMVRLDNLKKGEWRDGYFDIELGSNARQGITPMKVFSVEFIDSYNDYSITDY